MVNSPRSTSAGPGTTLMKPGRAIASVQRPYKKNPLMNHALAFTGEAQAAAQAARGLANRYKRHVRANSPHLEEVVADWHPNPLASSMGRKRTPVTARHRIRTDSPSGGWAQSTSRSLTATPRLENDLEFSLSNIELQRFNEELLLDIRVARRELEMEKQLRQRSDMEAAELRKQLEDMYNDEQRVAFELHEEFSEWGQVPNIQERHSELVRKRQEEKAERSRLQREVQELRQNGEATKHKLGEVTKALEQEQATTSKLRADLVLCRERQLLLEETLATPHPEQQLKQAAIPSQQPSTEPRENFHFPANPDFAGFMHTWPCRSTIGPEDETFAAGELQQQGQRPQRPRRSQGRRSQPLSAADFSSDPTHNCDNRVAPGDEMLSPRESCATPEQLRSQTPSFERKGSLNGRRSCMTDNGQDATSDASSRQFLSNVNEHLENVNGMEDAMDGSKEPSSDHGAQNAVDSLSDCGSAPRRLSDSDPEIPEATWTDTEDGSST